MIISIDNCGTVLVYVSPKTAFLFLVCLFLIITSLAVALWENSVQKFYSDFFRASLIYVCKADKEVRKYL